MISPIFGVNFENIKFHSCYDGDTCTFTIFGVPKIFGEKIKIRVFGIDAPEIRGSCLKERRLARKAKEKINSLLQNAEKIQLMNARRGKYFRLIANIVIDNKDISYIMLKTKLVRRYVGAKRKSWCD
jgi:endonuclease YncB( thermonuclease family)